MVRKTIIAARKLLIPRTVCEASPKEIGLAAALGSSSTEAEPSETACASGWLTVRPAWLVLPCETAGSDTAEESAVCPCPAETVPVPCAEGFSSETGSETAVPPTPAWATAQKQSALSGKPVPPARRRNLLSLFRHRLWGGFFRRGGNAGSSSGSLHSHPIGSKLIGYPSDSAGSADQILPIFIIEVLAVINRPASGGILDLGQFEPE